MLAWASITYIAARTYDPRLMDQAKVVIDGENLICHSLHALHVRTPIVYQPRIDDER